jgi:hypothetical protein
VRAFFTPPRPSAVLDPSAIRLRYATAHTAALPSNLRESPNNHAEREIRAFVLWRKRSFGTQSARGNTFAENLMTVAHTARKQHRNVLAFLSKCCEAQRDKTPPPSLFDAVAA